VFSETWAILSPAQQAQAKTLEAERNARLQTLRQRGQQRRQN
jgi:hypothetical protein